MREERKGWKRGRGREQVGGTGDRRLAKFHVRSVGSPGKKKGSDEGKPRKRSTSCKQMQIRHLFSIDGEDSRDGGRGESEEERKWLRPDCG